MPRIVEVRDRDAGGFLTPELRDFLKILEPNGRNLIWSILDLEARSDPDKFTGELSVIEKQIQLSAQGLILDWKGLVALADTLIEVLDGLFVGCKDRNSIPTRVAGDAVFSSCEIGIEAVDSSMWRVYARDESVLQEIAVAFREINFVSYS